MEEDIWGVRQDDSSGFEVGKAGESCPDNHGGLMLAEGPGVQLPAGRGGVGATRQRGMMQLPPMRGVSGDGDAAPPRARVRSTGVRHEDSSTFLGGTCGVGTGVSRAPNPANPGVKDELTGAVNDDGALPNLRVASKPSAVLTTLRV